MSIAGKLLKNSVPSWKKKKYKNILFISYHSWGNWKCDKDFQFKQDKNIPVMMLKEIKEIKEIRKEINRNAITIGQFL